MLRHNPIRILALVTDAFGGRGGIAQYNRDLLAALSLSDRVREVVVLPRFGVPSASEVPSKIIELPPIAGRLRFSLAAMRLALHRGPFDVVFCGHVYSAPLAYAVSKMLGKPMWLQVHGIDAWESPNLIIRWSVERADLLTAVSRYTRRRVLQWAFVSPERVRVLPNTMHPLIRERDPHARISNQYPFAGKPYLITVARINKEDEYKGHRRVLDVLPEVRLRYPDLQYVVAGEGSDRLNLEAYAAQLGLTEAVHFLGYISPGELSVLLAASRAFVMPSSKEGFGIVFLEAAAYGIPVIGGNVDGSVDALCDGAIGTIVDLEGSTSLREAIEAAVACRLTAPKRDALARFSPPNFQSHVHRILENFDAADRV
jgi:phosphatidylinositol alpha-1,6-mannosyltransferase